MTDSKPYLSNVPPTYVGNFMKMIPLFREFNSQNPPIWAAHTRTNNMLCTPPGTVHIYLYCVICYDVSNKHVHMQRGVCLFLWLHQGTWYQRATSKEFSFPCWVNNTSTFASVSSRAIAEQKHCFVYWVLVLLFMVPKHKQTYWF